MDDETRRHYDALKKELEYLYPNDARTPDQIGFVGVNYWQANREPLEQLRDGAVDYAKVTVTEPEAQTRAVADIERHYTQQINQFENHCEAALKQIFHENGLPYEDQAIGRSMASVEEQRVKVHSNETLLARKQTSNYINQDGGQIAQFAARVDDGLPEDRLILRRRDTLETPEAKLQVSAPSLGDDIIRRSDADQAQRANSYGGSTVSGGDEIVKRAAPEPPKLEDFVEATRTITPAEKHIIPGRDARHRRN